MATPFHHPHYTRRAALQAGALGLLGLSTATHSHLLADQRRPVPKKSVIYIFLSGGLAQHDSFDPKPNAPDNIRGEFKPIATKTPGIQICEHLPLLAARSPHWALVRSLTHPTTLHSDGHHMMLTGRTPLPTGFSPNAPNENNWPSIAALAGATTTSRNNLPPAVVLPDRIIHNSGRVLPGQFAGLMGRQRDPFFLESSTFESKAYGAFPTYEFDHQDRPYKPSRFSFDLPDLALPSDIDPKRMNARTEILKSIDAQRRDLELGAQGNPLDRHRQNAISMLMDPNVRRAFDIKYQSSKVVERYGNHSFGWSLLMAARLVEAGVNLVQVNLGNNETWDTHGNAFPHLKDKLFPPTDRAVSALIDDLLDRGLFDDTLIVMASEFGRTPKIFGLPQHYKLPGRDHWGHVQTVFFAGGGVRGGTIIGSSDAQGGRPATEPQTPENLGATIYHTLGIPPEEMWLDAQNRPHHIYWGTPIKGLLKST
jgi:hypothetical protein